MTYKISDIPTHNAAPGAANLIESENATGPHSEYSTLAELIAANTIAINSAQSLSSGQITQMLANMGFDGIFIGMSWDYDGIELPARSLFRYGQSLSRTTYAKLFSVLTKSVTATAASGNATLTGVSEDIRGKGLIGAKLEGTNIAAGATIVSATVNTIVMSLVATGSGATTALILPNGMADGTHFNLPDDRDAVNAGRGDMGGTDRGLLTATGTGNSGLDATILGKIGGVDRYTLTTAQLAFHAHGIPAWNGTTGDSHYHTQVAHSHFINDPGHAHAIWDGGHTHTSSSMEGYWEQPGYGPYSDSWSGGGGYTDWNYLYGYDMWGPTGVTLYATTTNVSFAATTAVNIGAYTGITTTNPAGGAEAHPNVQPTRITNKVIYTGVP